MKRSKNSGILLFVNYVRTMTVDTEKYLEFVEGVTSNESLHYASLIARTNNLELEDDCNVPQLLTAALGLTAESGEFTEIVKKIIILRKKRQRNLSMDSSSKLTTEELTELERLISSDTVSCNEEEQEFWNTIVRKLRNHHDS